ncbi:MAG: type VI secretion system tube protein Hcp [Candidatus Sumerlaeaceae bacterium]|nr:type VI secretion system tube protein Hcp [Candidatus Sumerlaeaceae bacterium]
MKWTHALRTLAVGAVILAASSFSTTAYGAAYIKFDGVDGESKAPMRMGWIDLISCSHDITNMRPRASGGGGGAGKASFSDISFAKRYDKSSPKLAEACASGQRFALNAVVVVRQPFPYRIHQA